MSERRHLRFAHHHAFALWLEAGLPEHLAHRVHRMAQVTSKDCETSHSAADDGMTEIALAVLDRKMPTQGVVAFVEAYASLAPDGYINFRADTRQMARAITRLHRDVPPSWAASRDWVSEYAAYVRAEKHYSAGGAIEIGVPLDLYGDGSIGRAVAWSGLLRTADTSQIPVEDLLCYLDWFTDGAQMPQDGAWEEILRWHRAFGFEQAGLYRRAGIGIDEALAGILAPDAVAMLAALRA
jgi:hypothetical protein